MLADKIDLLELLKMRFEDECHISLEMRELMDDLEREIQEEQTKTYEVCFHLGYKTIKVLAMSDLEAESNAIEKFKEQFPHLEFEKIVEVISYIE